MSDLSIAAVPLVDAHCRSSLLERRELTRAGYKKSFSSCWWEGCPVHTPRRPILTIVSFSFLH